MLGGSIGCKGSFPVAQPKTDAAQTLFWSYAHNSAQLLLLLLGSLACFQYGEHQYWVDMRPIKQPRRRCVCSDVTKAAIQFMLPMVRKACLQMNYSLISSRQMPSCSSFNRKASERTPGHLNKVMGRQVPSSERLAAGCIAGTWALTCDLAMIHPSSILRVQGATNWAANPVAHGWGVGAQVDYLGSVPVYGYQC